MLMTLFHRLTRRLRGLPLPAAADSAMRHFPTMAMAAELLTAPSALMQLSQAEAQVVVRYMRPKRIGQGTVFIREGDTQDTNFMALVLEGDVIVETMVASRTAPITLTVQGPGSMHGELSLIDGLQRSASCTASSDLSCAILTREGMTQLLKHNPQVGAKLMMAIAMRIGDRLRDNTDKLKKFVQLTKTLQQEVDELHRG
jgi:CRP/FNR family cyclic AMP-dependent transcriptional regulator